MFHTVRHLKDIQIYHRAYRKKFWTNVRYVPERRSANGSWIPAICGNTARSGPFRFCFLNQERELRGWNDIGIPKLWLYNLHYFDSPDPELMQIWIRNNPSGTENGWEPYPLSRRIVNWIKWERTGGLLNPAVPVCYLARRAARASGRAEPVQQTLTRRSDGVPEFRQR